MRVCIHRGTKEIGGNCVELAVGGKHLLLDLGMPITAPDPKAVEPPDVPGLVDGADPNFLGVIVSHPHPDHYGLLSKAHPKTPVYIGREADILLRAAAPFSPFGFCLQEAQHYSHRRPFSVGPFRITPFLNDHSAFDAYSLLVEAGGKTLFYTGDIRAHGRKSRLFEELLVEGPADVDVLLMEGTTIGRSDTQRNARSERELEGVILASLKETPGIGLAWFSAQNIDRFVTFFRAAKRAGRCFVVDLYLAQLLTALARNSLPSPTGPDIRVFLPARMKQRIVRQQSFKLVKPYYGRRIYSEELRERAAEIVMNFRPTMSGDLVKAGCLSGGLLAYSMWPGYLDRSDTNIREWCLRHGVTFEIHHTSGHATLDDLQRMVAALTPRRVVPIHSIATDRFSEFFPNVFPAKDGEWWDVGSRPDRKGG